MKQGGNMNFLVLGKFLLDGCGGAAEDTGVAVSGGTVISVDSNARLLEMYPDFTVWDRRDCIISPGFVNAHMHAYGILSHGITPPEPVTDFEAFLNRFWWPLVENRLDGDMIEASSRASALELLDSGVTAFCDVLEAPNAIGDGLERIARVAEETGQRAVLSFEACERISREHGIAGIAENRRFFESRRSHPRISGMMCIHTTFTCSRDFIKTAAKTAREIGSGIQMHLNESRYEPQWCLKHHGKLPAALYEELGFLGSDVLASQGVKLSPEEIKTLSRHGVRIVHVPLSNCEVGGGFSPVPQLLAEGVTVGLGTDGYVNNFFEVMRGAFLLHKAHLEDPQVMPAETVFMMATAGGADAVGLPGCGRILPGGPADIITINADLPTPINRENIFSQLILYRGPADVRDVWTGGELRKEQGSLCGFDLDRIRRDVQEQAQRLWNFT